MVRGFKKRYETQIKGDIPQKEISKDSYRQQNPRRLVFTWK